MTDKMVQENYFDTTTYLSMQLRKTKFLQCLF